MNNFMRWTPHDTTILARATRFTELPIQVEGATDLI